MGDETGEVHETANGFEWRIDKFFCLSYEDRSVWSPLFTFNSISWSLGITDNDGYFELSLLKESGDFTINIDFSLALKTVNGEKNLERHCTEDFDEGFDRYAIFQFISSSELIRKKAELVPFGVLTVVCTFKTPIPSGSASDIATTECYFCKETFSLESISSHEKKCTDKPIKCPECSDVVLLQSWYEHECQKEKAEVSEKFLHDFKTMLNGELSDVIVKVKEVEFQLHKVILAARNPYFASMFKTDMKEKSTGIVTIEDCDPDIFRSFIHFLYSGNIDKLLSPENVCDLYEVADKYQEDQLKKKCLHSMMDTLSVDSFCNYFVLALRQNEKELFEKAVELFKTKGKEIARSVKWQTFVKEYPIQANELFIKILDHYM